jgi:hypothetical protein
MKRKQVNRTGGKLIIYSVVTLLALALSSLAEAAPAISPAAETATYGLNVFPQDLELCVGEQKFIKVTVPLIVTRVDNLGAEHSAPIYNVGEGVVPTVDDRSIATILPNGLETTTSGSVYFDPDNLAPLVRSNVYLFMETPINLIFEVTGNKKGTTQIHFEHTAAATRHGRALTVDVQVNVVDCWEAYATGLWTGNKENNWTKKDICSLERPFVLEGNGAGEGGGATSVLNSKAYFFWPMGEPFGVAGLTALQDGSYVYVGGRTDTFGSLISSCTSVGSGSYQQFIFENRTPIEGNLILNGSIDTYCEGYAFHTNQEAIQVAFRALGVGQVCEESLPGLHP